MGLRRHRNTACNASRSKNASDKTFDFFDALSKAHCTANAKCSKSVLASVWISGRPSNDIAWNGNGLMYRHKF